MKPVPHTAKLDDWKADADACTLFVGLKLGILFPKRISIAKGPPLHKTTNGAVSAIVPNEHFGEYQHDVCIERTRMMWQASRLHISGELNVEWDSEHFRYSRNCAWHRIKNYHRKNKARTPHSTFTLQESSLYGYRELFSKDVRWWSWRTGFELILHTDIVVSSRQTHWDPSNWWVLAMIYLPLLRADLIIKPDIGLQCPEELCYEAKYHGIASR